MSPFNFQIVGEPCSLEDDGQEPRETIVYHVFGYGGAGHVPGTVGSEDPEDLDLIALRDWLNNLVR